MNYFKGTPGPWTGKDVGICRQDDAGLQLGFIMTFDGNRRAECAANAHLIAAAPELLEALQNAKLILTLGSRVDYADWRNAIQQCDAVITKALGETK